MTYPDVPTRAVSVGRRSEDAGERKHRSVGRKGVPPDAAPPPDSPLLKLSAASEDHHGGGAAAKAGDDKADDKAASAEGDKKETHAASSSSSDTTARTLGIIGILIGVAGVAFGVLAGRRRNA
ncbi:YcnI family protein OS=Streptomyces microflavus OX=1919 GN=HUT09_17510 PE=4 SV=1 [Streptomyces microflavus]